MVHKDPLSRLFLDGSSLSAQLLRRDDYETLQGTLEGIRSSSPSPESMHRRHALEALNDTREADQQRREILELLKQAHQSLKNTWCSTDESAPLSNFSSNIGDVASHGALHQFSQWLSEPDNDRNKHAVADAFLHLWLTDNTAAGTMDIKPPLERHLRERFAARIQSHCTFSQWSVRSCSYVGHDPSSYTPNDHATYPVCVPVLLAATLADGHTTGVVRWLTVELFQDGLCGFVPDLLTLGMTSIAEPDSTTGKSFLQHMDDVWQLSGLGAKNFCGRWRILNRAPLHRHYMFPELRDEPTEYLSSLSGNSAQAAAMVALLAASGQVFDPVHQLQQAQTNGQIPKPVFLNLDFAVTAGIDIQQSPPDDPRQLSLTRVGELNAKLSGVSRFSSRDDDSNAPQRLYAMLVADAEYREENKKSDSVIAKAKAEEDQKEAAAASDNSEAVFHGVRYRPIKTIHDALDAMLESNQFREALMASAQDEWLKLWSFPKNKHGQFLDREGNIVTLDGQPITDEDGKDLTQAQLQTLQERSLNSGSLEYMEKMETSEFRTKIYGREASN